MQYLVLCMLLAPAVYGAGVDVEKCAWGESYWCSELNIAKSCGAIEHCKTTVWKNQELTSDSTEVCEFCQTIVDDVRKFVTNKKTEAEIAHFLSTACAIIPDAKFSNECKTIVEEFTPEILDLIISAQVSSQQVCRLIHLCSGVEDTVKHADVAVHSSPLKVPLYKDDAEVGKVNDAKLCNDCKTFFGDVVKQITGNDTLNQLEALINQQICSQLGTFKDECNQIVKEFLPLALQYLQQFLDPNVICQALEFCPAASQQAKLLSDLLKTTPYFESLRKAQVDNAVECRVCEAVFKAVQSLIRDQTVQTRIITYLKTEVCAQLGTAKATCLLVVDTYSRQSFEFLTTLLDPVTRCTSFGFCSTDAPSSENAADIVRGATPQRPQSSASVQCILCEYVMQEIETILQDNKTEAKILEALDKVCNVLPSTVRQSCVDFINTYGQAILSILETEVTPAQVCTALGLCSSRGVAVDLKVESKPKEGDAETCLICETLIQYVETLIKDNSTVQEVEDIVKKICNFLPDTMKSQCDSIIDQYGALIVQYIISKYDPKEVCTLIKLCPGTQTMRMVDLVPSKPRHVDAGKCSFGPMYWCASLENAEDCGAVEHCKKFVWSKN